VYEISYERGFIVPALTLIEEFAFGTLNKSVILEVSDNDIKVGTLGRLACVVTVIYCKEDENPPIYNTVGNKGDETFTK
jgi:hypothetical protein